jgi:hypothetical protein
VPASLVSPWRRKLLPGFWDNRGLAPEPAQRFAARDAISGPAAGSYHVYQVDLGTNKLQEAKIATASSGVLQWLPGALDSLDRLSRARWALSDLGSAVMALLQRERARSVSPPLA